MSASRMGPASRSGPRGDALVEAGPQEAGRPAQRRDGNERDLLDVEQFVFVSMPDREVSGAATARGRRRSRRISLVGKERATGTYSWPRKSRLGRDGTLQPLVTLPSESSPPRVQVRSPSWTATVPLTSNMRTTQRLWSPVAEGYMVQAAHSCPAMILTNEAPCAMCSTLECEWSEASLPSCVSGSQMTTVPAASIVHISVAEEREMCTMGEPSGWASRRCAATGIEMAVMNEGCSVKAVVSNSKSWPLCVPTQRYLRNTRVSAAVWAAKRREQLRTARSAKSTWP